MKRLILLTTLVLAVFAGSILEVERTRVDHSSRANKFIITFALDTTLASTGELHITMPPPGIPAFTTSTVCEWNEGSTSGYCVISSASNNVYTI